MLDSVKAEELRISNYGVDGAAYSIDSRGAYWRALAPKREEPKPNTVTRCPRTGAPHQLSDLDPSQSINLQNVAAVPLQHCLP